MKILEDFALFLAFWPYISHLIQVPGDRVSVFDRPRCDRLDVVITLRRDVSPTSPHPNPNPKSPSSISRLPTHFDKPKNRFAFQMLQTGKCVSGCDSPIRADQDFPPYRLCDFKVERQEPLKPTGRRISAPNQERAPNGIEKTSSMSLAPGRSTSIFRPRSGRMAANDRCAATRRRCMLPQCQPA